MRTTLLILLLVLGNSVLAGIPYHRSTSLRFNLLNHVGAGFGFPMGRQFSGEVFARAYAAASVLTGTYRAGANFRTNIKYHFQGRSFTGPAPYILSGLNFKTVSSDEVKDEDIKYINQYTGTLGVLGFGLRIKNFDFWLAGEYEIAHSVNNTYTYYYSFGKKPGSDRIWKPPYSISGGIALVINFEPQKFQFQYE